MVGSHGFSSVCCGCFPGCMFPKVKVSKFLPASSSCSFLLTSNQQILVFLISPEVWCLEFGWYLFGAPPRHDTSSPLVFGSLYRETQKTRFVCCFLSPLNSITKLHQHQLPSEVLPTGMSSPNFVTAFSWREYSYLLSSTANTGNTIFFLWSRHCGCRGCWQRLLWSMVKESVIYRQFLTLLEIFWSTPFILLRTAGFPNRRERFCRAFRVSLFHPEA